MIKSNIPNALQDAKHYLKCVPARWGGVSGYERYSKGKAMDQALNTLNAIGYGIDDYIKMFALTDDELKMNILDCCAGVSNFCGQMTANNYHVTACDPLYAKPLNEIQAIKDKAVQTLFREIKSNPEKFNLSLKDAEQFVLERENVPQGFFQDFSQGVVKNRYTKDGLPELSFKEEEFGLVLLSHYLFDHSLPKKTDFHVSTLEALMKVTNEVRIFPLVDHKGELSNQVGEVAAFLQAKGYSVEIRAVPYCFQKQANAMMSIFAPSCTLKHHSS